MGKALQKKETNTQLTVPDFVEPGQIGLENVRAKDIVLPRMVLMQALSPKVTESQASPGDVFNSLTDERIFGNSEEQEIVPIYHFIQWIEWGDRNANEGMIANSLDPRSDIAMSAMRGDKIMRGGREDFRVTEYHNIVVILLPTDFINPNIVLIPFARTNYKVGRKFLGLARMRGNYPLYAGKYIISTETEVSKANQKYKVFAIRNAGWVKQDEYQIAKLNHENLDRGFRSNMVKYDIQNEPDPVEESKEF